MTEPRNLTPADPKELKQSLAFALRYRNGKRTHDAEEMMARIVAERLVEHLRMSGYVVMQRPPAADHGVPRQALLPGGASDRGQHPPDAK